MLRVEVANTPSKREMGLMFRKHLPFDSGMVFVFERPQKLGFWGVNTYLPLDIAFVDESNRIVRIADIKPLSSRMVESPAPCSMAIEANLGFFQSNRISAGDIVDYRPDTGEVFFRKSDVKTAQEIIDPNERQRNLPVVTPDDVADSIVDDIEGNVPIELEPDPPGDFVTDPAEIMVEPELEIPKPEDIDPPDILEDIPPPIEGAFPEFDTNEQAVEYAAENSEAIRIHYVTKGGKEIERDVEPHGMFIAKTTGNPILVTWDRTAGGIRGYIIPRIIHHQFVGQDFEPKFRFEGGQGAAPHRIEKIDR